MPKFTASMSDILRSPGFVVHEVEAISFMLTGLQQSWTVKSIISQAGIVRKREAAY
jgi:hypothetical protein